VQNNTVLDLSWTYDINSTVYATVASANVRQAITTYTSMYVNLQNCTNKSRLLTTSDNLHFLDALHHVYYEMNKPNIQIYSYNMSKHNIIKYNIDVNIVNNIVRNRDVIPSNITHILYLHYFAFLYFVDQPDYD
jgi:hypothetical protein